MNELSLFAGAGGSILAGRDLGFRCIGAVEIDDYCQRVLRARQEDGSLETFPIFGDISSFITSGHAASYKGMVDVITAGVPCQDFSVAGKRAGWMGKRNLWPESLCVIEIIRPRFILFENVPGVVNDEAFARILGSLWSLGYDARWDCLAAADAGACHLRKRLWIVCADADEGRCDGRNQCDMQQDGQSRAQGRKRQAPHSGTTLTDAVRLQLPTLTRRDHKSTRASDSTHARNSRPLSEVIGTLTASSRKRSIEHMRAKMSPIELIGTLLNPEWCEWFMGWPIGWTSLDRTPEPTARDIGQEPSDIPRTVGKGYPHRVDRIKALGNGWVPPCAAMAWRMLTKGVGDE